MPSLALSSFSLHSRMGPLYLERRDEEGKLHPHVIPFPKRLSMEAFVQEAGARGGFAAVELCQLQFDDESERRISGLRSLLEQEGVTATTIPIDIGNLTTPSDVHRQDDVERITRWFEIAQRLGASNVRVNAGAPAGGGDDVSEKVVDALRDLSDRAAALNLRLLVENHGGASSDPDFMLRLLDAVGRDRVGLLLDLGNFEPLITVSRARIFGTGMSTEGLDTGHVYRNIERLAPAASVVHAKAFDPADDGSPLLDLDRALRIVKDSGYSGPITIEWEGVDGNPWDRIAETVGSVRTVFPSLN